MLYGGFYPHSKHTRNEKRRNKLRSSSTQRIRYRKREKKISFTVFERFLPERLEERKTKVWYEQNNLFCRKVLGLKEKSRREKAHHKSNCSSFPSESTRLTPKVFMETNGSIKYLIFMNHWSRHRLWRTRMRMRERRSSKVFASVKVASMVTCAVHGQ